MLDAQTILQLERYIKGELSPEEHSAFTELIAQNTELQQRLLAEKLTLITLAPNPVEKARKIADILGEDLFMDDQIAANPNADAPQTSAASPYTLEELLDMFSPVEYLEAEAWNRSSSGLHPDVGLQHMVILPENDIDCPNNVLYFAFDSPLTIPLDVFVLNNKEEEITLSLSLIPEGSSSYIITLPNGLPPGKYYWQLLPQTNDRSLRRKYGMATGSFYVKNELNPQAEGGKER